MLIMEPVLETYEAADFTLWPTADQPADRLLVLSGDLSPLEVGTAMAVLAGYNKTQRRRHDPGPADGLAMLRRLVSVESVVAPGGLRLQDSATGVTVPPGCCFGLENWRDWQGLLDGETPWLGHDPTPGVEPSGSLVRLWPDAERPAGLPIELALSELPVLLESVRSALTGFLGLVEGWTVRDFPAALAARVVAKLDEDLAMSGSLREVS
ncbi:hypothetical protein GCM10011579_083520 [Streptomyces albiflavescens]|uniref:Uncharacterized protein n=1 Tax=Streptomyces albiflavescens TaxID=1623582 RepID=A0A918D927_9ACTN|nr:hypothetical protein GCM10011579_083520 [Streptomyces albiflavescens]